MVKEVVKIEKKDELKHHQEIITKANTKLTLETEKSKYLEINISTCMKN
jgi:hypothetical protein